MLIIQFSLNSSTDLYELFMLSMNMPPLRLRCSVLLCAHIHGDHMHRFIAIRIQTECVNGQLIVRTKYALKREYIFDFIQILKPLPKQSIQHRAIVYVTYDWCALLFEASVIRFAYFVFISLRFLDNFLNHLRISIHG